MKKILALILIGLLTFGCTNIQNSSFGEIINSSLKSKSNLSNQHRNGYKYYLPRGLSIFDNTEYNEIISSSKTNYYLFIDFVSYHNKKIVAYQTNDKVFYSQEIKNGDKFGYLEIKEVEEQFYVEMMYNYAKIEMVTNKEYLNEAIYKAIVLLSSIKYNDIVIEKMMNHELLSYKEMPYNIFKPKENFANVLDYVKENSDNIEDNNLVPDSDLIK